MSTEASPKARARYAKRRYRQERRWASQAGAVSTSQLLGRPGGSCYWCGTSTEGLPIALHAPSSADKWWGHLECIAAAKGVAPM